VHAWPVAVGTLERNEELALATFWIDAKAFPLRLPDAPLDQADGEGKLVQVRCLTAGNTATRTVLPLTLTPGVADALARRSRLAVRYTYLVLPAVIAVHLAAAAALIVAAFEANLLLGLLALSASLVAGLVTTAVQRRLRVSDLPQQPVMVKGRVRLAGVDDAAAHELQRLNPDGWIEVGP
jgi:hypothetical protein